MPNHGAVTHYGNPFASRNLSITPAKEDIHTFASIASMKRGSRREQFRSLPDTIIVNNKSLPVRWVA